ncbi:MAG: hypothetical protein ACD_52C00238G0001 [uncultured bacterium]|nr:MAG: hypothetical protein ACD_52C00238G0001 [uncultured bacterium]
MTLRERYAKLGLVPSEPVQGGEANPAQPDQRIPYIVELAESKGIPPLVAVPRAPTAAGRPPTHRPEHVSAYDASFQKPGGDL